MSDSEAPKSAAGPRRRRGRRGGRGRARRLPEAAPRVTTESASAPVTASAPEAAEPQPVLTAIAERVGRIARDPELAANGSAISKAIEEVSEIVESLKRVLDQMEEVLELTELAERQKMADEREIDSLRRALRQLQQRPRFDRPRDDDRPERPERPARRGQPEPQPETDAPEEPQ